MTNILTFLKGIVVGVANVVPGLSGGTMAVVLNIYPKLLEVLSACTSFDKTVLKKNYLFICYIGVGVLVGIAGFSHVIDFFIQTYPEPTSFFFMGVVLASLPFIVSIKQSINWYSWDLIGVFLLFFCLGLYFYWMSAVGKPLLQLHEDIHIIKIIFSCMVASSAMIIPGISGSLVLVLFGTYSFVIYTVKSFDFSGLLLIFCGVSLGLLVTTRLINKCLTHYYSHTIMALLGLICGTLPGLYVSFSLSLVAIDSLVFLLGIGLVYLSNKI